MKGRLSSTYLQYSTKVSGRLAHIGGQVLGLAVTDLIQGAFIAFEMKVKGHNRALRTLESQLRYCYTLPFTTVLISQVWIYPPRANPQRARYSASNLVRDTKFLNQVDGSVQNQVLLECRKPDIEYFADKPSDFAVNPILLTGTNMPIDDLLDVFLEMFARDCAEYGIQDDREVYDIAHYAADILLTDRCERSS
jgi:hypothetical protein